MLITRLLQLIALATVLILALSMTFLQRREKLALDLPAFLKRRP